MLIADLVQEVLYETPHAPEPIVEQAILRSTQEFCQRTRRWVVDGTDITTIVGTTTYTLAASAQTDSSANALDFRIIGLDSLEHDDDNKYYANRKFNNFTYNDGVITLTYTPTKAYTLKVKLQLKPSESATAIYDPLYEDYSEGILSGAKYRLMRMKGVTWEDQQGAIRNEKIFDKKVHQCRTNKWNQDGSKELNRYYTGW